MMPSYAIPLLISALFSHSTAWAKESAPDARFECLSAYLNTRQAANRLGIKYGAKETSTDFSKMTFDPSFKIVPIRIEDSDGSGPWELQELVGIYDRTEGGYGVYTISASGVRWKQIERTDRARFRDGPSEIKSSDGKSHSIWIDDGKIYALDSPNGRRLVRNREEIMSQARERDPAESDRERVWKKERARLTRSDKKSRSLNFTEHSPPTPIIESEAWAGVASLITLWSHPRNEPFRSMRNRLDEKKGTANSESNSEAASYMKRYRSTAESCAKDAPQIASEVMKSYEETLADYRRYFPNSVPAELARPISRPDSSATSGLK